MSTIVRGILLDKNVQRGEALVRLATPGEASKLTTGAITVAQSVGRDETLLSFRLVKELRPTHLLREDVYVRVSEHEMLLLGKLTDVQVRHGFGVAELTFKGVGVR